MARHVLMVYTYPYPGREDEYHRWYDESHLAEVLSVPGFVEARRFVVTADPADAAPVRYVALYTIESDDIEATMAGFERARPTMSSTPALDLASVSFQLLSALGPAVA
jgi:hypothetical protein